MYDNNENFPQQSKPAPATVSPRMPMPARKRKKAVSEKKQFPSYAWDLSLA